MNSLILLLILQINCLILHQFKLLNLQFNQNPEIVQTQSNPEQWFQEGKNLYETGQYIKAAEVLQQAVSGFAKNGDQLNQAIALSNLSLVWQQLGKLEEAEVAIHQSLTLINSNSNQPLIYAQILETQAQLFLAQGKPEQALETWKKTAEIYGRIKDYSRQISSHINQAQALQSLGLYRQALKTLTTVQSQLEKQPNSILKATGLLSLGNALRLVGDLENSDSILKKSLAIAQSFQATELMSEIYLSLGNTALAQDQFDNALKFYQQAEQNTHSYFTQLYSSLNQFKLLLEQGKTKEAEVFISDIDYQFSPITPSRMGVYALVNFAKSLAMFPNSAHHQSAANVLARAIEHARILQDQRAESYAIGSLGTIYEKNQQALEAQKLTEEALLIAQRINAPDIAYQWQWQLGRLLKEQGKIESAIAAYSEAVNTLQSLRSDLVAINSDVQFSFRESVEPVYRELVDLILRSPQGENPSQANLKKARGLIEALQIAELDNFFREACLDGEIQAKKIDEVDSTAAVIYPIILPDRLAIILSLPGQPLYYYSTNISQTEVNNQVRSLQQSLRPVFSTQERLRLSQTLYNWLIHPLESDLKNHQIQTLVFVLDGALRNIPMAALHDGKHYLVENYNLAITPGLQLLASRSLKPDQLQVLSVGLSQARQGFVALPAVESELNQIQAQIPSKILLNQNFTRQSIEAEVSKTVFPVVHLATHGQFSSKAEDTFLLTWDDRINVKDLDQLLRNREQGQLQPIELLVLSACQTAAGDGRAALGLAGIAVRSGARSTLATLWQVNDTSTATLMTQFYQELKQPNISKAEALRRAQLKLLQDRKYQDPYYWAAFVLVGNWL